jgi:subtilisin family serine protease
LSDPQPLLPPHLRPAPRGIGVEAAWEVPGGRGEGLGFVDLEIGWHFHHRDLEDLNITRLLVGRNCRRQHHGTGVLGVVAARGGPGKVVGIARGLDRVAVASPLRHCWGSPHRAEAIQRAARALSPGDVLLIEDQITLPGFAELPPEASQDIGDAIRSATSSGIVVVEPAGNREKPWDLDELENEVHLGRFRTLNPASPQFVDSGAILVAAATSTVPHRRHPLSNFGRRVDCYAWGEGVYTCGSPDGDGYSDHTADFGGTSAAAAMIAGIALSVQGMVKAATGAPFKPARLRRLLGNPEYATPSENGPADRIGVMPDLARIVHKVIEPMRRSAAGPR